MALQEAGTLTRARWPSCPGQEIRGNGRRAPLLCGVPIDTADRLMAGDRPDPVLILARRPATAGPPRGYHHGAADAKGTSNHALEAAFGNFEKLSSPTAQRVVRFWQVRQPEDEQA